jgi:hypothetical protein
MDMEVVKDFPVLYYWKNKRRYYAVYNNSIYASPGAHKIQSYLHLMAEGLADNIKSEGFTHLTLITVAFLQPLKSPYYDAFNIIKIQPIFKRSATH